MTYTHTQNGLAESFVKHLKFIARALILNSNFPFTIWRHATMHAETLIWIRPSAYHSYSPIQLVCGHKRNISHLRVFGCAVYVPIAPPQCAKMGPQRRLSIYVGYESPAILKYLEALTNDLFITRFVDSQFDEAYFLTLR